MNVVDVTEVTCLEIEIEKRGSMYSFRRQNSEVWEELIGQSWESVSYTDELEQAYQEWVANK